MPFRRTRGILTGSEKADPAIEADVIMTAAVAGFTAGRFLDNQPVRFDINPAEQAEWGSFERVIKKLNAAVEPYVRARGTKDSSIKADYAPKFDPDHRGVIMGVYQLAGHTTPAKLTEPVLTEKGRALYDRIRQDQTPQYVGVGAYTGFVDNPNTEGNTDPVGPRSTARFLIPDAAADGSQESPVHRWLPSTNSPVWHARLRRGTQSDYVPWGVLGGESAAKEPDPDSKLPRAANRADQMTAIIESQGMAYVGKPLTREDIVGYTHGMIQAVYKAYSLGPACVPYEIAVGDRTTKLASCFPCTMFITSLGYPPSSSHLGRGESWAPLYQPHNPGARHEPNESAVIRDLNTAWAAACGVWLQYGIGVLAQAKVAKSHAGAVEDLYNFVETRRNDPTVGATLILDALTIHQKESTRIDQTLENP
ncbi:MAG TPA: hypothetical protein VF557_12745 [Jatrophihabitans sp.]|jgi:hypothetical protein|uniref:hypothetical protein n=1 Tax=Jatrophihabitans sp. TaxID=1932789 RepID=UPI002F1A3800